MQVGPKCNFFGAARVFAYAHTFLKAALAYVVCRSTLHAAHLALQRRAVKQWLAQQPCMRRSINFAKVEAVLSLLDAPNNTMTMTLARVPQQRQQQQGQAEPTVDDLPSEISPQELVNGKTSRRSARKRVATDVGQAVAAQTSGDCVQMKVFN